MNYFEKRMKFEPFGSLELLHLERWSLDREVADGFEAGSASFFGTDGS